MPRRRLRFFQGTTALTTVLSYTSRLRECWLLRGKPPSGACEPAAAAYNSLMKIKLGWIIAAVCLVSIGWLVVPRLTFWISAKTPSASEPARENQASPRAAIETMFQMMSPPSDPNSSEPPMVDRFNQFHLLSEKI